MQIFNTTNQPLLYLFYKKLAHASIKPTAGAQKLVRKLAYFMRPIVKLFGTPSIQFFGAQSFEYNKHHFGIDLTWIYPKDAIDGVQISFMIEESGKGFQFILVDPQKGTICDDYNVGSSFLDLYFSILITILMDVQLNSKNYSFTIP